MDALARALTWLNLADEARAGGSTGGSVLGWPGSLSAGSQALAPVWPLKGASGASWDVGAVMCWAEALDGLSPLWKQLQNSVSFGMGRGVPRGHSLAMRGLSHTPGASGWELWLWSALLPSPGWGGGHHSVCQPACLVKPGPTPAFGVLPSPGKPLPALGPLGQGSSCHSLTERGAGARAGPPGSLARTHIGGSVWGQPSLRCAWVSWPRATHHKATLEFLPFCVGFSSREEEPRPRACEEVMVGRQDLGPGG